MVPYYMDALPVGVKPVVLTSIGFWEGAAEVPQAYLDMLTSLASRTTKVLVVSIPRVRVPDPQRSEVYRGRNEFMRQWVNQQGEPFTFVDFDALSMAPTSPPGGAANNWHYMCSVTWRTQCSYCQLLRIDPNNGVDPDGLPATQIQGNVERMHMDEDGFCADETNRNLWQVVMNTVVKSGKAVGGSR